MFEVMKLEERVKQCVLRLDGAMGTMIQSYGLTEEDFRGELFRDCNTQMRGNNDLLVLTRPDVILDIHRRYLQAGADIITANTFSSQRVSMADYGCEHLVAELNREAVHLARQAVEEYSTPEQPRYVIATVGPTNKTCSMSPDVNDPAFRAITYDELCEAYREQMVVLLESGVDAILLETIFDTLNAKAGIYAYEQACHQLGLRVPLMLSVTINDRQGRLLSGQSLEAFLISVSHADVFSVGLNCSFGAHDMLPCLRALAQKAPYYISVHPNAGLPNTMGGYDQSPEMMRDEMCHFVEEGLVNIIGGCCGTTPEHIAAMAPLTAYPPHVPVNKETVGEGLQLCGLDPMVVSQTEQNIFVNVGERCNVSGSRRFLRLIREGNYEEALSIARKQVEDGAMVIDVNMDDGLLDVKREMVTFLNLLGSEPDICRVPIMLDSSNWDVIRAGLRCVQGKCIVNSISLKEGEDVFLSHAREIRMLGAAVVVMAFDEEGQAVTYERRIAVCRRAYDLLVNRVGIAPQDIIFDPNVLAVATGMSEHDAYALDFIRATRWIRENLPGAHVSGGVSNLSFSFRGNNYIRESMHAVFLYHAQQAGLDMGIINPSARVMYADIPPELLRAIEEVMLHPSPEASERLIEMAANTRGESQTEKDSSRAEENRPPAMSLEEHIADQLQRGITDGLEDLMLQAVAVYPRVVDIIEGPLMEGMRRVGTYFGEGKMFLPQVVKTARTMKKAVSILQPYLEAQRSEGKAAQGRIVVATVKGDVHDIGKNIVSVVMACNGYEVIDLGVMVPAEDIVAAVKEHQPDLIGLSGLITPSLEEMVRVVSLLRKSGINIPVMIGGATTSALHTALLIAPAYDGPVIWVKDASQNAPLAAEFLAEETSEEAMRQLQRTQQTLRESVNETPTISPLESARKNKLNLF